MHAATYIYIAYIYTYASYLIDVATYKFTLF